MEPPSPARLYATVVGFVLLALGILGFFYDASFAGVDSYEHALGVLRVNGWINAFLLLAGAVGLLLAEAAPRPYSLGAGLLFTGLAILGWGTGWLMLAVGLLGLAAAAGTAKPGAAKRPVRRRRRSRALKPRAKPAGKRT
jgi:uncharacterized protein DUF4383